MLFAEIVNREAGLDVALPEDRVGAVVGGGVVWRLGGHGGNRFLKHRESDAALF